MTRREANRRGQSQGGSALHGVQILRKRKVPVTESGIEHNRF
jgi:hypothetical protein